MSEESSNELDKMFQLEPEQLPFKYNSEAWKEMEILLDKDDRRRIFWWFFAGVGAILLIGGIWFLGKGKVSNQMSNSIIVQNEKSNEVKKDKNVTIYSRNLELDKKAREENLLTLENETNFSKNKKSKSKSIRQNDFKNKRNFSKTVDDDFLKIKAKKENQIAPNNSSDKKIMSIDSIERNETILFENLKSKIELSPIAYRELFLTTKPQKVLINLIPKTEIKPDDDDDESIILPNPLYFGIAIGPEFSKVNQSDLSTTNWKIGGYFEYRFRKKWGVSAGANFIQKKYGANGNEYSPPVGFWDEGVPPTTVDADCDILEIPINISFFKNHYRQDGFYSSIGINSFFMLNEQYDYFYNQSTPNQIEAWGGANKNKHWFGIGEISIGYQKDIDWNSSIQIGTYFQIPLTGVGHGNINLWSAGMHLKLNLNTRAHL